MGSITVQQALAWVSAGQQLVAVGAATVAGVSAWIKSMHPGLPEADLNAILDNIAAGAARHKALATADAGG